MQKEFNNAKQYIEAKIEEAFDNYEMYNYKLVISKLSFLKIKDLLKHLINSTYM